jgi:hypothetical protein
LHFVYLFLRWVGMNGLCFYWGSKIIMYYTSLKSFILQHQHTLFDRFSSIKSTATTSQHTSVNSATLTSPAYLAPVNGGRMKMEQAWSLGRLAREMRCRVPITA